MKTTMTQNTFINEFNQVRPGSFSRSGLAALFEYFEMLEDDCGCSIEFDPIAIDCEYSESESAYNWCLENGYDPTMDLDQWCLDDDKEEICINFLRDNTQVIEFNGGVIAVGF